jgi:hypothetical protein
MSLTDATSKSLGKLVFWIIFPALIFVATSLFPGTPRNNCMACRCAARFRTAWRIDGISPYFSTGVAIGGHAGFPFCGDAIS